ncbi:MAG: hypothetical protein AAGB26_12615 [Planctomycetota bacterium]
MDDPKPEVSEAKPAEKPKRTKLRWVLRQTRRLVVLVSVALLVFVVGFAIYAWRVNASGDRAVAQIERELADRGLLDLYWDTSDRGKDGWYRYATNARYWRAAMQAVPDAGDRPLLTVGTVWVNDIEHRQQYHPDMVAALRDVFEAHPRFLELVNDAVEAPPGRFGMANDLADPTAGLEVLGGSRSVARWLEERARLAVIDEDGGTYIWAITAMLELSNLLDEESHILAGLASGSLDAIARDAVMDALSRIEFSTEQLDRLIAAFEQRQQSRNIVEMIGHDLSWQFHYVSSDVQSYLRLNDARQSLMIQQLLVEEPDWIDTDQLPSRTELTWQNVLLTTCPGRYEMRHAELLEESLGYYDQIKSLGAKPRQCWAYITQTLGQIKARDEDKQRDLYFSQNLQGNNVLISTRTFLLLGSNLTTMVTALQVERYRVARGDWPATLEDATGDKPFDSFGEPLGYRITTDGVFVFSKGCNTIDEGGYGKHDGDLPSRFQDADDLAFRLYNPETRNSLPPTAEAIDPDYDEFHDD